VVSGCDAPFPFYRSWSREIRIRHSRRQDPLPGRLKLFSWLLLFLGVTLRQLVRDVLIDLGFVPMIAATDLYRLGKFASAD
jgi:hypothetical protein